MARFRKRPVEVEAVRWTGENAAEVADFMGLEVGSSWPATQRIAIPTLDSVAYADPGDWVLRGTRGELYPCKPEIFEETYEAVPDA